MGALFLRHARLTISTPVSTPGDYSHTTSEVREIDSIAEDGGPGLRIAFSIDKSAEKEPNTNVVKIYNLSPTSRKALERKPAHVMLEAGYVGAALSRYFSGDVRTCDHVRQEADWITTLKCGDGERGIKWSRLSYSFAAGTTAGAVLKRLALATGLAIGNANEKAALMTTAFDAGYAVHGSVQMSLDRLIKSVGLTWSVQDGALQVLAPDESLSTMIPLISPTTGLIGSPEAGTPEKTGKPILIKWRSLLTPTKPGGKVRLQSERYNGQFAVKKCHFEGDTFDGPWYTDFYGVMDHG